MLLMREMDRAALSNRTLTAAWTEDTRIPRRLKLHCGIQCLLVHITRPGTSICVLLLLLWPVSYRSKEQEVWFQGPALGDGAPLEPEFPPVSLTSSWPQKPQRRPESTKRELVSCSLLAVS